MIEAGESKYKLKQTQRQRQCMKVHRRGQMKQDCKSAFSKNIMQNDGVQLVALVVITGGK